MKFHIRAAFRLRATDRSTAGRKLFLEMARYLKNIRLSKLDGTIQADEERRPLQTVLKKLGFVARGEDSGHFERSDMSVDIIVPHDGWNSIIQVVPNH